VKTLITMLGGCPLNKSSYGTKRTNMAGLMMSVVRGRPEVTGREAKWCD
jgi:hypothetical protein